MNRQNLINRLVAKKLQPTENARAICINARAICINARAICINARAQS